MKKANTPAGTSESRENPANRPRIEVGMKRGNGTGKVRLTPLLACSCESCAIPQMLFNHCPGAVFRWAVECPYCGKATTWRKTEQSAAKTWNDRHANNRIE